MSIAKTLLEELNKYTERKKEHRFINKDGDKEAILTLDRDESQNIVACGTVEPVRKTWTVSMKIRDRIHSTESYTCRAGSHNRMKELFNNWADELEDEGFRRYKE